MLVRAGGTLDTRQALVRHSEVTMDTKLHTIPANLTTSPSPLEASIDITIDNSLYIECLGCKGSFIPEVYKVNQRFCYDDCEIDFRAKRKMLDSPGSKARVRASAKVFRSPYLHNDSAIGMMERMFENEICLICFSWNGLVFKDKNSAFCRNHLAKAPDGFKCPVFKETNGAVRCGFKQKVEGICPKHSLKLVPYWEPNFDKSLDFLKGKPKLKKWHYAQIAQGRGLERGLETLDRVAECLGLGNGTAILDKLNVVENKAMLVEFFSRMEVS